MAAKLRALQADLAVDAVSKATAELASMEESIFCRFSAVDLGVYRALRVR